MKRSTRRLGWAVFCTLAIFILATQAHATDMADENFYGFTFNAEVPASGAPFAEYLDKVKEVGGGWMLSEGPGSTNTAVTWSSVVPWFPDDEGHCDPNTMPDLTDWSAYRWDDTAWVDTVSQEGLDSILPVATNFATPEHMASCWVKDCEPTSLKQNCPPRDWGQWYQFVYHVVGHFNGADPLDPNQPRVRYFTSIEEPDNYFFYSGSTEDLLGASLVKTPPNNPVIQVRDKTDLFLSGEGGNEIVVEDVLPGYVPVAHRALRDANKDFGCDARYVLGALMGSTSQYSLVHLYQQWAAGTPDDQLDTLADSYNMFHASQYPLLFGWHTWESLLNFRPSLFEDQERMLSAMDPAIRGHYDIFSVRLVDSRTQALLDDDEGNNTQDPYMNYLSAEGYQRVLYWVREQLPRGMGLWVTCTSLTPNPYDRLGQNRGEERPEAFFAYYILKTMTVFHATGVEWMMFNSIRNLFTTYGLWDYGQVADDPKPKTDGAFAFSMMSDLIPTSSSVRGRRAYEYRGTGWEPVDPDPGDGVTGAVPDAWTAAGLLYRFNLAQPESHPGPANMAVGWCVDADPKDPRSFDASNCPVVNDICGDLGISDGVTLTRRNYRGELEFAGSCPLASFSLEQAPFVLTWETSSECHDRDGDGYGSPAHPSCPYAGYDCNDDDPNVSPAMAEGPAGDPTCSDGLDNNCDGDNDDEGESCAVGPVCIDLDLDGYGRPGSETCTYAQEDCDDEDSAINPGVAEKLRDGKDNNCDGRVDEKPCGTLVSAAHASPANVAGNCFLLLLPLATLCLTRRFLRVVGGAARRERGAVG